MTLIPSKNIFVLGRRIKYTKEFQYCKLLSNICLGRKEGYNYGR